MQNGTQSEQDFVSTPEKKSALENTADDSLYWETPRPPKMSLAELAKADADVLKQQFQERRPNVDHQDTFVFLSLRDKHGGRFGVFRLSEMTWTADEWQVLQEQEEYHQLCAEWVEWWYEQYGFKTKEEETGPSIPVGLIMVGSAQAIVLPKNTVHAWLGLSFA